MKYLYKIKISSALILLATLMLWSCKKDEAKVYYLGGTNPVLTASTNALDLAYANADQTAVVFSWTNPDYKFTTGVSSQDVTYLLEIDTTGSNFTNPSRQQVSISKNLTFTISEGTFNDYLLNQLQLVAGVSHNLDVRVTATLTNNSAVIHSNVVNLTATPYTIPPKVTPPSTGTLFIVGSAVPVSGWNNPISPASQVAIQQFTPVSPTVYSITIALLGGGSFKLIAADGSWNEQWSTAIKNDPNEVSGGDFIFNGNDALGPVADGTYKIVVDFQRGKFSVTKQ
ncbi:MAG TPA: SusE domain-containing protein [Puia sp.]|nr:SusE domain-containing protein [Puia sp.]